MPIAWKPTSGCQESKKTLEVPTTDSALVVGQELDTGLAATQP